MRRMGQTEAEAGAQRMCLAEAEGMRYFEQQRKGWVEGQRTVVVEGQRTVFVEGKRKGWIAVVVEVRLQMLEMQWPGLEC